MDKKKNLRNLNLNYAWNVTETGNYQHLTSENAILECAKLLSASEGLYAFLVDRDGAIEVITTVEGEISFSQSMEASSLECQSLIGRVNSEAKPFLLFVADDENQYFSVSNEEIFLMREKARER